MTSAVVANTATACFSYAVFVLILLHLLRRDYSVRSHMVSDYGVGPYGWLMSSWFIAMSGGLLMLLPGVFEAGLVRSSCGSGRCSSGSLRSASSSRQSSRRICRERRRPAPVRSTTSVSSRTWAASCGDTTPFFELRERFPLAQSPPAGRLVGGAYFHRICSPVPHPAPRYAISLHQSALCPLAVRLALRDCYPPACGRAWRRERGLLNSTLANFETSSGYSICICLLCTGLRRMTAFSSEPASLVRKTNPIMPMYMSLYDL